ncbi:MAG TPA: LON peptidase substrate-binding domain-containing protein [Steroidobacteraceae bacterium]|nr:LON peptidase substrate-binding domain-containing protein [Steroidobacteraceae bacterium]
MPTDIALFPLGTVLFPGGLLPLRIFETRYTDMVRRCMREDLVFGVVRIEQGSEVSATVQTATCGTSARIVDFQTLDNGLLGVLCRGEARFRILSSNRQADGLNRAQVEWVPEHERVPVSADHAALVTVLRESLSQLATLSRFIEPDYEDAGWVSYRLAELLPLPTSVQQQLLETSDPVERLSVLTPLVDVSS